MVKKIIEDKVLIIAIVLAIVTSIFIKPSVYDIDFNVLIVLFNLMVIIKALEEVNLMDYIATSILKKLHSERLLALFLVLITFFSSMFITNDVALITFVPLTLIISQRVSIHVVEIIIFQTIAANVGSSMTPLGNPQNLLIYYEYQLKLADFLDMALLSLFGLVLLIGTIMIRFKHQPLQVEIKEINITDKRHLIIYLVLFLIVILGVMRFIDEHLVFIIVLLSIGINNYKLFKKVDYQLLGTFVACFIVVGNLEEVSIIRTVLYTFLSEPYQVYFSSIILSQIMSNVPTALLLTSFTPHFNALLLGVNIGGLGTLIASLASLISYKLFRKHYKTMHYMIKFTFYNILYLVILSGVGLLFIL
jgi:Na+/H+ antiporter NhaD/arsenite permease-like protein